MPSPPSCCTSASGRCARAARPAPRSAAGGSPPRLQTTIWGRLSSAVRAGGSTSCAAGGRRRDPGKWSGTMRRVVSLWLPRFATDRWERSRLLGSRQQSRARPPARCSTSGKRVEDSQPLALVADQIGRLTLAAVNEAAEAGGLAPGLPLAEARALVPGPVTLPHEPRLDARALAETRRAHV